MAKDYLKALEALRLEALDELRTSPMNYAFVVLDNAVVDLGGKRAIIERRAVDGTPVGFTPKEISASRIIESKRVSGIAGTRIFQGDAAEQVLIDAGMPLRLTELANYMEKSGFPIGGTDKIASLRSALSRDNRFRSIRLGHGFFWWLNDHDIPV